MNEDESVVGTLPFEFQCKTTANGVSYHKLLNEMPGKVPPCILHRYTVKSAGGKFIEKGRYVVLKMSDFEDILEKLYGSHNEDEDLIDDGNNP